MRTFIVDIEKYVSKYSFKELRQSPSKTILQNATKGFDGSKDNQAKQIEYFVFNEKYFHIDVSRCVITPQHI